MVHWRIIVCSQKPYKTWTKKGEIWLFLERPNLVIECFVVRISVVQNLALRPTKFSEIFGGLSLSFIYTEIQLKLGYFDWGLSWFYSIPPGKCHDINFIRSWRSSLHSCAFLPFNVTECGYWPSRNIHSLLKRCSWIENSIFIRIFFRYTSQNAVREYQ